MHSHIKHVQVVHSQPPGVRLLHNLSLFTVSFLVSIYSLTSQTHFRRVTKREESGSDLSPSVVFSLPFRIMYLCLPLYSHLRLTESHSHPRKTANWPTNALRACLLGGVQILQRRSKYYCKIWTGGSIYYGDPNTTWQTQQTLLFSITCWEGSGKE